MYTLKIFNEKGKEVFFYVFFCKSISEVFERLLLALNSAVFYKAVPECESFEGQMISAVSKDLEARIEYASK